MLEATFEEDHMLLYFSDHLVGENKVTLIPNVGRFSDSL